LSKPGGKKAKASSSKGEEEADEEDERSAAMSHFSKKAGDKIMEGLQKTLSNMLPCLDTVPSDKRDLMHSIFHPQAFAQLGDHWYVGLCPHGVAEVRLITEGGCWICGLDKQHVQGETLQASS